MGRLGFQLLVFALILLEAAIARSAPIPVGTQGSIEISAQTEIHLDKARQKTFNDVSTPGFPDFQPSPTAYPSFGIFPGNAWFRFELQNTRDQVFDSIITFNAPLMECYLYVDGQMQKAGRLFSDAETSLPSRMPSFKVTFGPHETKLIYVMAYSELVYNARINVMTHETYFQQERSQGYFAGFYAGIMAIMILYNAFLWYSTRDRSFIWYILTVLFLHFNTVSIFVANGDLFGVKNTLFPRYYTLVSKILGIMALMQFSRVFLRTHRTSRLMDNVLRFQLIACLPLFVLMFLIPPMFVNILHNALVTVGMTMTMVYSGYLFFKGHRYARFYFIAWFPLLLLGTGLVTLNALGYGRWMVHISNLLMIVPISEVLLLSMALGDKLNEMKLAQERSEREHKEQILAINQGLEQTVREKTRDIRSMLDNLKIGIFTVDRTLAVDSNHSQYLSTIVGEAAVKSSTAIPLMFSDSNLGPDRVNQVESALLSIIGAEEYGYLANEQMLIRSYERHVGNHKQCLEVDWAPILDEEAVIEKMLVSLRDVTELNQLRQENQSHQRRVETLEQCLKLGSEKLLSIINDLDGIVQRLSALNGTDGIGSIFADVHTLKAQTRQHQLTYLSDALHLLEDYLQAIRNQREVLDPAQIKERLAMLRSTRDDYQLIVQQLGSYQQKSPATANLTLESLIVDCLSQRISLARELDKPCPAFQLDLQENLELDAVWSRALMTALVHLVRNSLDHGLETSTERLIKGKNPEGLIMIRLRATPRGYRLEYSDDGQGLDLNRVRAKAIKREILRADQKVSDEELAAVIFQPGFSTKETVSQISGRGVGLDAAVQSLHRLGAEIRIELGTAGGSQRPVKFVLEFPKPGRPAQKAS